MGRGPERKIPAQRRTEIRALLGRRGGASIAEIADAMGVSGSTVRRDLDELDREGALGRRNLGVAAVTNDVGVASVLAEAPGASVVVPGGEIRDGSFALLGSYTQAFPNGLHVDVAFVGIHAVTGDVLSESSLEVVEAKRAMMRAAHRVVLLADHSKFRPPSFFEVARMDRLDDLITDDAAPPEALEAACSCGVRVHLA